MNRHDALCLHDIRARGQRSSDFRTQESSSEIRWSAALTVLVATTAFLPGCGSNSPGADNGAGGSSTSTGGQSASGGSAQAATGGGGSSGSGGAAACDLSAPAGETVMVPAATFGMGCVMADTSCKDDEKPLHMVSMSVFALDKTEVTQAEYTGCVKDGACSPPSCDWDCSKGDLPASCVNWADAKAYCTWAKGRLPTEAEWEFAARGTDGRVYPWGNDAPTCDLVDMDGCGEKPASVGSHPSGASPYGAMDMAGNVVEMVADYYAADYYATSPAMDPKGPATGAHYVGRGGGYKSEAVWQRASARDTYDAEDSSASLGFRCAH